VETVEGRPVLEESVARAPDSAIMNGRSSAPGASPPNSCRRRRHEGKSGRSTPANPSPPPRTVWVSSRRGGRRRARGHTRRRSPPGRRGPGTLGGPEVGGLGRLCPVRRTDGRSRARGAREDQPLEPLGGALLSGLAPARRRKAVLDRVVPRAGTRFPTHGLGDPWCVLDREGIGRSLAARDDPGGKRSTDRMGSSRSVRRGAASVSRGRLSRGGRDESEKL